MSRCHLMATEYVPQVVGLPDSDVGHLMGPWGAPRQTLCGRPAIEQALHRIDREHEELYRAGRYDEAVSWWVDATGRRPCADCLRAMRHQRRWQDEQIEAMGGRP